MKKTEHEKVVKAIRADHERQMKLLERWNQSLTEERDFLKAELAGCREALQETTKELAAVLPEMAAA